MLVKFVVLLLLMFCWIRVLSIVEKWGILFNVGILVFWLVVWNNCNWKGWGVGMLILKIVVVLLILLVIISNGLLLGLLVVLMKINFFGLELVRLDLGLIVKFWGLIY